MIPLALLVGLVGGFLPVVNVELFLLAATAAAGSPDRVALVLAAATGQMLAEATWYAAGTGALALPFPAARRRLATLKAASQRHHQVGNAVLVSSATLGLPPFALIGVWSGMVRVSLATFLTVGLAGRFVRFSAVVLIAGALVDARP
jgi:membrane protein YqaA with SNARE-associated domain